MAVQQPKQPAGSSAIRHNRMPPTTPTGGGGGNNVVMPVDVGVDLQTRLSLSGESTPVDAGVTVGIGPLSIAVPQEAGVSVAQRVTGATRETQEAGVTLQNVISLNGESTPVDGGAEILRTALTLVRLSGGSGVTEEAVGGRTDWANDANATGKHDGSDATIAGNAVGARGGRLVLDYAAFTDKAHLIIDQVQLHFYTNQAGTIANNGDLKHQWRRVTGGTWITLATFTGNQDSMTTPATYDITTSIGSWADLEALQTGVEFASAIAELQTAACDAVEIEINAHLLFDPADVPGLAAWYRADAVGVQLADAAAVSTWDNMEGTAARDMLQATGANQPTIRHNVINGQPVVRFDGSNDFMSVASAFLTGTAGSIFAVIRPTTIDAGLRTILSSADTGVGTASLVVFYATVLATGKAGYAQRNAADTQDTLRADGFTQVVNTPYIVELHSDGSTITLIINGAGQTLTVVGGANNGDWFGDSSGRDNTVLGGFVGPGGASQFFVGDMGDILAYDGVTLTEAEKSHIREWYLSDKYGISV